MKTSTVVGIIVAVLIIIGGVYLYMQRSSLQPGYQSTTDQSGSNAVPSQPTDQTQQPSNQTQPTPSSAPAASNLSVDISKFAFSPVTETVKKGTTVTWLNHDTAAHTVTGNNGGPSSGQLAQGMSYSYTFNTVGTFPYHCANHPTMQGTVVVTE